MDTKTGKIYAADEFDRLPAEIRGRLIGIPDDQIDEVRSMNRKQRRAWAAQQRRAK